jgi:hypothetical protein
MALLGRGDRSVTEACFPVGCASLGSSAVASPSWSGCPGRRSAPGGAGDGGEIVVRGETGDQTGQESRSAAPEPQLT